MCHCAWVMLFVGLPLFFFNQKTAYDVRLSLVGSEMFIRDSGTRVISAACAARGATRIMESARSTGFNLFMRYSFLHVSYTPLMLPTNSEVSISVVAVLLHNETSAYTLAEHSSTLSYAQYRATFVLIT